MRQALLLALFACATANAQVVISQVYGGGGNSGAIYTRDYVELYNYGSSSVPLAGYSIQYASATGTGNFSVAKALTGTIAPGGYYLVALASGANGAALPTPDESGSTNMSATAGKVILASVATGIACNGGSTSCTPAQQAQMIDLVGYGTANFYKGSGPAPGPTSDNKTALIRAGNAGNNAADFVVGAPNPHNSGGAVTINITPTSLSNATATVLYTVALAASGGTGPYTWSISAGTLPSWLNLDSGTGALSGTPADTTGSPFSFTVQALDSAAHTGTRAYTLTVDPLVFTCNSIYIGQVQGSTGTSPYATQTVTTRGIVTALKSNGFFLQSPAPGDNDPTTSDGIFVFTSSAPTVPLAGDVCVTGKVSEYVPDPNGPSFTELGAPLVITTMGTGMTLPTPVTLTAADTDPNGGLDVLERYESMRVHVDSLTVVQATGGTLTESAANSTSSGAFYAVITGVARPFREPGVQVPDPLPPSAPAGVTRFDANPERLRIASKGQAGATGIDVTSGALVTNVTGVLDYGYRTYTIDPDPATVPVVTGNVTYTPVPASTNTQLSVVSFNMERFYDTVSDGGDVVLTQAAFDRRMSKASLAIRNVLNLPDILCVEEMEKLSTLQALADKVNAEAAPATPKYVAYLMEGNDIGKINVGFLVKSSKVTVLDVTQFGKTTTYTNPDDGTQDILWDRPPLMLRALAGVPAMRFTVIVNHFRSLSDVDSLTSGRVRVKREAEAEALASLIQSRQAADPTERIISVGDYNAYQFSDGYVDVIGALKGSPAPANQVVLASPANLTSPGLTDAIDYVAASQQYSYVYDGSAQALDHVLMNNPAVAVLASATFARNDADFPEIYRNDAGRPERISDHDMPVVYFTIPALATDVTSQVSVFCPGFIYNRVNKTYNSTLKVTNIGAPDIAGPIRLCFANMTAGIVLVNRTGTYDTIPCVTYPASLARGAVASVPVSFSNPANVGINPTIRVYSGSF